VFHAVRAILFATLFLCTTVGAFAQAPMPLEADPAKTPAMKADVDAAIKAAADGVISAKGDAHKYSDIAWMLVSCALVMLMMPGLALFYGGMARRKNVLGTMMHTMVALGLVGVQWVVIGYALAFGSPMFKLSISSDSEGKPIEAGFVGYSKELFCLGVPAAVGTTEDDVFKEMNIDKDKATDEQKKTVAEETAKRNRFKSFPNTNLPLYLHAMFQGMFAIITVALVSGAFAERVKFGSYLLFALLWTTIVYDPLAHMVWSFEWTYLDSQKVNGLAPAAGLFGANGAIDFAGGTVVHIAAGFSGLAAILVLRKRIGYGKQTFHPNSMVLTLLGAGLLWFGWFGFNGGSALYSNPQAVSAFTVTQVAAAAAALAWMIVEWLHRGKPTGLGFASGLVAGLVAITPASGFVAPSGALAIGLLAGVVCYWAVAAKSLLGYDDSLDAFGIHGVGGFLGAILTAVFVSLPLWVYGSEMLPSQFPGKTDTDPKTKAILYDMSAQLMWQIKAACFSAGYAFLVTIVLVLLIEKTIGFTVKDKDEAIGLDLSQHGEVGVDVGPEVDGHIATKEPKAAATPPINGGGKKFAISVAGATEQQLIAAWSQLCQASDTPPSKEFAAVYPYVTTVSGNTFRFRGGDPVALKTALQKLFADKLGGSVTATVV
jgi:ammonium transporter